MKVMAKDVGQRFKVTDRPGEFVLVALSKDGKTAYLDTEPETWNRRGFDRYKVLPVERLYRKVHAKSVKGEKAA
ncbi:MAG: hypothetical protein DMF64_19080 [Acidobacteria bacterium]|nr:MAG: hypothetical protein DMF64_19080 [Acidobacteriota bacterium]